MKRRTVLAAGGAIAFGGLAGCLADDVGDTDGYGPEPDEVPEERTIDTDGYETYTTGGVDVPLAPIEDVVYWYQRQEARVVDARGSDQYDAVRIAGAALSSAPDGGSNDPVADWPEEDRIVTYCVCPHALAGQRAASLIQAGYEEVYAIDEGLEPWIQQGHPIEGEEVQQGLTAYHVQGVSDAEYAGDPVQVRTLESDQSELSAVDPDGSFELTLHFTGLDDDSLLAVEAPDYTVEATLAELTSTEITPDLA